MLKSVLVITSLVGLMGAAQAQTTAPAAPVTPVPAAADTGAPAAAVKSPGERRQARQQKRIAQGVASGQLTPRETATLEKQEAHIDKAQQRATADGQVTPAEKAHVQAMENRESRKIHRKKHNERTAG